MCYDFMRKKKCHLILTEILRVFIIGSRIEKTILILFLTAMMKKMIILKMVLMNVCCEMVVLLWKETLKWATFRCEIWPKELCLMML